MSKIQYSVANFVGILSPTSLEDRSRVIDSIERYWAVWDLEMKQRVLRTYAPQGFKLAKGVLQATICGLAIEVDLPILPPPTKGMKYGAAKGTSSKSSSKRAAAPSEDSSDSGGVSKQDPLQGLFAFWWLRLPDANDVTDDWWKLAR